MRLLAEALGLDDGEQAVLAAAVLATPAPPGGDAGTGSRPLSAQAAPRTPEVTVPRQLPADIGCFTGRSEYIKDLDQRLPGKARHEPFGGTITVIAGTAGIGKPKPRKPYTFACRYGSSLGTPPQHSVIVPTA